MGKRSDRPRTYDSVGVVVLSHRQEYLEECLESVRSQTSLPAAVIVVDNGSSSDARVSDLAQRMGFESVRLERPKGRSTARNVGCELLDQCDVLVSLDGDDVLLPRYLEEYVRHAASTQADVVYGAAELFGTETGVAFTAEERRRHSDLRGGNFIPANSLFRREMWRSAGGYDPHLEIFEDWDRSESVV